MRRKYKPSVLNYTDYRKFLSDYIRKQKKRHKTFSSRLFARRAGYNSSGLLTDVIKGRSNIRIKVINKFSAAIGQSRREAAYFKNLVYFNQADSGPEKNLYFNRMMRLVAPGIRRVQKGQLEYFSRWYYTAIREVLSIINFKNDYKTLARELKPHISVYEAKRAIKILLKHGFVNKDSHGYLREAQPNITMGPEVKSLHVANFQRVTIDLAKEAIDRFPSQQREISTLTFSTSPEALAEIKDEINALHARMMDIIQRCKIKNQVHQFNFQLFPLSRERGA